jgi:hypothetical protein
MKIREGAYYRTRGGDVFGPMARYAGCDDTFTAGDLTWHEDGSYVQGIPYKMDLISEVYVSDTPPADAPAPEIKTLRDEFAMAALIGLTTAGGDLADCGRDEIAAEAWRQADAMMEAREK